MKVCNEVKGENKYQRDRQDVNSLTNKRITKQDIIDICLVLLNSESSHCLRLSLLLGDSRYIEKKLSECTRKNDEFNSLAKMTNSINCTKFRNN